MAMTLIGRNGTEFELGVTRESLPETQDGAGDERWATITFRAARGDDSWEESSPCLNLFELTNLAEWLEGLTGTEGETGTLELVEPELAFDVIKQSAETVTIRVGFHLDDRPEETRVDAPTDAHHLDLLLERPRVAAAAAELRRIIADLDRQPKDDLLGERDVGALGEADADLNLVDDIAPEPPFAGRGEDNAGET